MYDTFIKLFSSTSDQSTAQRTKQVADGITKLATTLGTSDTVRLYVEGGASGATSTLTVLDRLVAPATATVPGLGYSGTGKTVEAVYADDDTAEALRRLLAWPDGQDDGTYHGATVKLVKYGETLANVAFGFSGATANDAPQAKDLAVDTYLRLQPFTAEGLPQQIAFADETKPAIDLDAVETLGNEAFARRGTYVALPSGAGFDWKPYLALPAIKSAVQALQTIVTGVAGYDVLVSRAVNAKAAAGGGTPPPNALGRNPYDQLVELVLGAMATQIAPSGSVRAGARPVVLVNLAPFTPAKKPFAVPTAYLAGGATYTERRILRFDPAGSKQLPALNDVQRATYAVYRLRKGYLDKVNAGKRAFFADASTLATGLAWLKKTDGTVDPKRKVLVVQIGVDLPADLLAYLLSSSTLPPVIADDGDAALALNLPAMYYRVAPSGSSDILYPTTVLASAPADAVLQPVQDAANAVRTSLDAWPNVRDAAQYPPEIFAAPVVVSRAGGTDPASAYFKNVAAFYAKPVNEKASLALAYLDQVTTPPPAGPTLDDLWPVVEKSLTPAKSLQLVTGLFTQKPLLNSSIATFFTNLVKSYGNVLALGGATIAQSPETGTIETITAQGTTGIFGAPATVTLTFTAPDKAIVLDAQIAFTELSASPPGLAWIALQEPSFTLTIGGGKLTGGAASAQIALGKQGPIEIGFRFPTPDDAWLFYADTSKFGDVSDFFQLAGGVNLKQVLPQPFTGIAALQMKGIELVYASKAPANASRVRSIAFHIATTAPITLLPGIQLDESATLDLTVESPGDANARVYRTAFAGGVTIGGGTIELAASTPGFTFTGALKTGDTIDIGKFLAAFLPSFGGKLDYTGSGIPSISALSFSYNRPESALSVALDLGVDWTFPGKNVITVKDIGLTVDKIGAGDATGMLTGNLVLLPATQKIALALSAQRVVDDTTKKTGWKFAALQSADTPLKIGDLLQEYLGFSAGGSDLEIDGVGINVNTLDSTWSITASTKWTIPFLGANDQPKIDASVTLGRGTPPDASPSDGALMLAADQPAFFAQVAVSVKWLDRVEIDAWLNYSDGKPSFGITWGKLTGTVKPVDGVDDTYQARLAFTDDTTLGSMIETMISWLTGSKFGLAAPFSLLNDIPLSNLALVYTFNTKDRSKNTVAFDVAIGPIELGFASIKGIEISYGPTKKDPTKRGVNVKLQGSFHGFGGGANAEALNASGDELEWDAADPGSTPAPQGQGNKYFDLRLLALGQHVTADGFATANTIKDAIAAMRDLPAPDPGNVPGIQFDPTSSWLIGMDFGVLRLDDSGGGKNALAVSAADDGSQYFITAQIVFNDPHLYGLRLALEGKPAKIFAGLDFEIMYRQISENVGVYEAQLTLPNVMRHLTIGAASITLPTFAIKVYTNGDFLLDIGFPWNQDFTRSFTIEAIIPPGIPLLGSAGFYFGKLSSATSTQVPKSTKGTFNPVIVFGIGMQVGFGKSIEAGILSAGFSITAVGILEGVIAKWNPYAITDGGSNDASQVQGQYYFWLQGTFGIIGKLYGTVDFVIVKASVSLEIKLLLQLTYESYVSMAITVTASVSVSVSISINLGLFSIDIDFSFDTTIRETFTIDNHGIAPWDDSATSKSLLRASADHRLSATRRRLMSPALLAQANVNELNWGVLQPGSPLPLNGYLGQIVTIAGDENDPSAANVPCYVVSLFIDTVKKSDKNANAALARSAASGTADTSFEVLAKMVARWVIAATYPATTKMTAAQVDAAYVDKATLQALLATGGPLATSDANPVPIDAATFDTFLTQQFVLNVVAPTTSGQADATFFPMAPAVHLTAPAYGGLGALDYRFDAYNAIARDKLSDLRKLFDELAVQVQKEMPAARRFAGQVSDPAPQSVATWIVGDYALLIARQMVQAMLDGLRNFQFPLGSGAVAHDRLDGIVGWINDRAPSPIYTLHDLFAANPAHALNSGVALTVGPVAAASAAHARQSFAAVAAYAAVDAADLARTNAATAGLFRTGAAIAWTVGGTPYSVSPGTTDTLFTVAANFAAQITKGTGVATLVALTDMLAGTAILTQADLLADGAQLLLPAAAYRALAGDTFTSIAKSVYGSAFADVALAVQNAGRTVLRAGAPVPYPGLAQPATVLASETLGDLAMRVGAPDVTDLVQKANLLGAADLLAVGATLIAPQFTAPTSASLDTLQTFAARYAVTAGALGDNPLNGAVQDLFATVDDKKQALTLAVPHLEAFRVDALLDNAQRTLALAHLSGMAGRYYLHGLRLPTDGFITPLKAGMWVKDTGGALSLPPQAGLYALTGQQLPVPVVTKAAGTFTITLDRSQASPWLAFSGGPNANTLTIDIADGSPAATAIAMLQKAAQTPFDAQLTKLGAGTMATSDLATYPFGAPTVWVSGGAVALPYVQQVLPDAVPALRLWALPDAMTALPDRTTHAIDPRFALAIARYDQATGKTVESPVPSYGWASSIPFTVKRVPFVAASVSTKTTYQISGATATATLMLERLVAAAGDNDALFAGLTVAFTPGGTSGKALQSGAPGDVTMGIAQVDLSTETRPPAGGFGFAAVATPPATPRLLNTPSEFVRFLWEASITRGGGFYLYYYDHDAQAGLPDAVFDSKGEAQLTLIAVYAKPSGAPAQNRLTPYINAVATVQSIDTGDASLFARADPLEGTAPFSGTLQSFADAYYADVADVAEANADVPLASGAGPVVDNGVFRAPVGGIALQTVATNFGTSVAALNAANAGTPPAQPPLAPLPDPLAYPIAIRLPKLTVAVTSTLGTLGAIARAYGTDAASVGAASAGVTGLFAGGTQLTMPGGPRVRAAAVPPGVVAYEARRPLAKPVGPIATEQDALNYLAVTYNLLGYGVHKGRAFHASRIGLPLGPTTDAEAPNEWRYKVAIPFAAFAKRGASGTPYRGLGEIVQATFAWQDHFGNRIASTLSAPATNTAVLNDPPILTGYDDALLGLGRWPSVASSWQVAGTPGAGKIALALGFDPSRYRGPVAVAVDEPNGTIALTFTDAVDIASAQALANYTLTPATTISTAVASGTTVTLTTAAPLDRTVAYRLTVNGVSTPPDGQNVRLALDGWATFGAGATPAASVITNATRDAAFYDRLRLQLDDPAGIAYSVETTLGVDSGGGPLPIALDQARVAALLAWLFGNGGAASVYAFLADRMAGKTTAAVPPPLEVDFPIDFALDAREIFALSLAFTIARANLAVPVLGDLEDVAGIRSASTTVAPYSDATAGAGTSGLTAFASSFETALSSASARLKIATGVDRERMGSAASSGTVWAVRVGLDGAQPIAYTVDPAAQPVMFAPRPMSNTLESRPAVTIGSYDSKSGFTPATQTLAFSNIDLDVWGNQIFTSIDTVLSPQFTAAAQIVDAINTAAGKPAALPQALAAKGTIAAHLAGLMVPAFADDVSADPTVVREAFRQLLLTRLSNVYSTRAAMQYSATVFADAPGTGSGFQAAATGAAPTIVLLRFGVALDPATANDPSHYAVSDGVTVASAALGADGRGVTLALARATAAHWSQAHLRAGVAQAVVPDRTTVSTSGLRDANKQPVPDATQTVRVAPRLYGPVLPRTVFSAATIAKPGALEVTLTFSAPLAASGVVPASFSLKSGAAVTAAAFQAQSSSTVVNLTVASPGVQVDDVLTSTGAVVDAAGYAVAPASLAVVLTDDAPVAAPQPPVTASSPKLALWPQAGAPLAVLVEGPQVVRDPVHDEVLESIDLSLHYDATAVEHQIGSIAGVTGYLASSWLRFVVRDLPWPLGADLGTAHVPLALRAFPATPALVAQSGATSKPDGTPIEQVKHWDYAATYSLPYHYPQDRVHGTIEFNYVPPSNAMLAVALDPFAALAQFVTLFPQIDADLRLALGKIDATFDPKKDPDTLATATNALGAFVAVTGAIADAGDPANGFTLPRLLSAAVSSLKVVFRVEESTTKVKTPHGEVDALLVTLVVEQAGGVAQFSVDIEGWNAVRNVTPKAGEAETRFAFVYTNADKTAYLDAPTGQAIPGRSVRCIELDIVQRQNAWTTVKLERNEVLAGRESAPAFIYATPQVQFANPLRPTLTHRDPVSIPAIVGGGKRSLAEFLRAFLVDKLLAGHSGDTMTFFVTVEYRYELFNTLANTFAIPVLMQAPLRVALGTSGAGIPTVADMIDNWAQAITAWFSANVPLSGGLLNFDLGLMSDLTGSTTQPLMRLPQVQLAVDQIVPGLAVTNPSRVKVR